MSILPDIYIAVNTPPIISNALTPLEDKDYCLLINIEAFSDRDITDVYQYFVVHEPHTPFCFFCPTRESLRRVALNEFLSFFFLPYYKRRCGAPLLFVLPEVSNLDEINELNKRLSEQEIRAVAVRLKLEHHNLSNDVDDENMFIIRDIYIRIFAGLKNNEDNYILAQSENFASLKKCCEETEKQFTGNEKMLLENAYYVKTLNEEIDKSKLLQDALQKKTKVQKIIIDLLKTTHQATAIQRYYDAEYEVLPLWFKRIGHIIKVIMGKRKFRSLLDDNAKKYKN